MREPALILVVDDAADNVEVLQMRLESQGYAVASAADGVEALERIAELVPDLVLLDVMMPRMDGLEVCRRVKAAASLPFIPIVMVTARSDRKDIVAGLDAGADDYLRKPVDQLELMARVRSMLRIKGLQDRVTAQARELADLNADLERKVASQVAEIGRMNELRRFLAPQVVDLLLAEGNTAMLASHRRDIVVVCCDLRGFTSFAEVAEPEEVMDVLAEYHRVLGEIIQRHEGTLDSFAGDGVIVFFNDPNPVPDPALRALRMADEMRAAMRPTAAGWRRRGFLLGFGIGISQGFATLGRIGFEGRWDYTAIGTVVNLSARLCAEAADGEILVAQKIALACEDACRFDAPVERAIRGLSRPMAVYNLAEIRRDTAEA